MTTKPHPAWDLEFFWMVSPKVSDFFEGNFTSKTLTKFDDHQTSPSLGLRNFLDGLTKSVRLFCEKFYIQHFMSFLYPVLSKTENCSRTYSLWLMNFCMNGL